MNYPTEKQIKELKKWKSLRIEFIEECILCWFNNYHWILCVKIPEMTAFCLDCMDTFQDNKTKWRWVYQIWNWFIN